MRALVTGASGFVGRHLVAHLREQGDDVTACDHATGGPDILDAPTIAATIADARPDAVYHLAGWSDVAASWSSPREVLRTNAEGTLNVLLGCVEAGVNRVLVVSSADVYGVVAENELPITEDAPLRPVSPYAVSKVAADFLAYQHHVARGLGTIRVRAFNHLGPGQSDRFVAPAIAARVAANERSGGTDVAIGNLAARRDVTDVRDVVRAYRLLVEDGVPGDVYNVCSGIDVAVSDLAERLLGLAHHPMALRHDRDLERPVDIPVLRGDASRLRAATGWTPEIPLSRTLVDLLDDYRARAADGQAPVRSAAT